MLKRELLPFPADPVPPSEGWRRWFMERVHDLQASCEGGLTDPLHIQLPRDDARLNFALAILLAVMLYVSALAVMAQHVLGHAAAGLGQALEARITYEILPDTTKGDDRKSMEARATALQQALGKTPGVSRMQVLGKDTMAGLLQPWLGSQAVIEQLPLPLLIDVQLDRQNPATKESLEAAMASIPGVQLDDHARFQEDLVRMVDTLRTTANLVLMLTLGALMLTSYFASEATFHMNRDVIELLHLIGADDRAVAQHMGLAVMRMAVIAAVVALIMALLTLFGLWLAGTGLELAIFPNFNMETGDWALLIAAWVGLFLAALALCLLSSRFTVLRALRRLL